MTPKERWLAAIRMNAVDRLPFWPKLDGAYPKAQASPFCDLALDALHDWIGSDPHTWIAGCTRDCRPRTCVEASQDDGTRRTVYRSPHGELHSTCTFDARSNSWHPVEFPVKTRDDIRTMTELFDDIAVELDREELSKAQAQSMQIGQTALTASGIGESPLMYWVEWLAGVENAHYLLADHEAEVETLFAAIHRVLLRRTEILCAHSPADVLYLIENTSTTLISPDQYRRYCLPHVGAYARLTRAAGRNLVLHMCGHLKSLLPDLAQIGAQAFEAFTSPTLGNTRLLDGRTACPATCLIGGTNAMLWTQPPQTIIAGLERDLGALPHHRGIVVTSAGVMPPACRPETIRLVCEWVKRYPAKMGA